MKEEKRRRTRLGVLRTPPRKLLMFTLQVKRMPNMVNNDVCGMGVPRLQVRTLVSHNEDLNRLSSLHQHPGGRNKANNPGGNPLFRIGCVGIPYRARAPARSCQLSG